uniref:Uncharacterized protein n=1 Tax=viral metagenome TaxID=1070528 RepID=A0A6C0CAD8_9ZZZZ
MHRVSHKNIQSTELVHILSLFNVPFNVCDELQEHDRPVSNKNNQSFVHVEMPPLVLTDILKLGIENFPKVSIGKYKFPYINVPKTNDFVGRIICPQLVIKDDLIIYSGYYIIIDYHLDGSWTTSKINPSRNFSFYSFPFEYFLDGRCWKRSVRIFGSGYTVWARIGVDSCLFEYGYASITALINSILCNFSITENKLELFHISKCSELCVAKLILLKYMFNDMLLTILRSIAKKLIKLIGHAPFKLKKVS